MPFGLQSQYRVLPRLQLLRRSAQHLLPFETLTLALDDLFFEGLACLQLTCDVNLASLVRLLLNQDFLAFAGVLQKFLLDLHPLLVSFFDRCLQLHTNRLLSFVLSPKLVASDTVQVLSTRFVGCFLQVSYKHHRLRQLSGHFCAALVVRFEL